MTSDLQVALDNVKSKKLTVINLHEDDTGTWYCTLGPGFRSHMTEWRTGRAKTPFEAVTGALGFHTPKAKPKAKVERHDDLI